MFVSADKAISLCYAIHSRIVTIPTVDLPIYMSIADVSNPCLLMSSCLPFYL